MIELGGTVAKCIRWSGKVSLEAVLLKAVRAAGRTVGLEATSAKSWSTNGSEEISLALQRIHTPSSHKRRSYAEARGTWFARRDGLGQPNSSYDKPDVYISKSVRAAQLMCHMAGLVL